MKYLRIKNKKIRQMIKKSEHQKLVHKLIKVTDYLNFTIKQNSLYHRLTRKKRSSFVKISRRCILSNKKTIFNKKFRISRFMFLRFARLNILHGIRKNYW